MSDADAPIEPSRKVKLGSAFVAARFQVNKKLYFARTFRLILNNVGFYVTCNCLMITRLL